MFRKVSNYHSIYNNLEAVDAMNSFIKKEMNNAKIKKYIERIMNEPELLKRDSSIVRTALELQKYGL